MGDQPASSSSRTGARASTAASVGGDAITSTFVARAARERQAEHSLDELTELQRLETRFDELDLKLDDVPTRQVVAEVGEGRTRHGRAIHGAGA